MKNTMLTVNNQPLQFTQVITFDSVCSRQKKAEHYEHLKLCFVPPRFFPQR